MSVSCDHRPRTPTSNSDAETLEQVCSAGVAGAVSVSGGLSAHGTDRVVHPPHKFYRGTSLVRNCTPPGPCRRPMPRKLRGSCGGGWSRCLGAFQHTAPTAWCAHFRSRMINSPASERTLNNPKRFHGLLLERQDQILVLTVLHVPNPTGTDRVCTALAAGAVSVSGKQTNK